MKFLFSVIFFLLAAISISAQTYTAATYNIRYDTDSDGVNRWDNRKEWLVKQVKGFSPDILGTQEGLQHQVAYLDSALENFGFVGIGREDGKTQGEYSAIFYKKNKLESMESGTFWLSETPDTVSKGWGANFERICTYTLLFDEERQQHFWVFNAHLDHESKTARLESVKLVWDKIQQLNKKKYPVIFMGDLNATPDSPPISFLSKHMNDSKMAAESKSSDPLGTFNAFDTSHPLDRRIDYIFVSDAVQVYTYKVINEIKKSRTPSDHLPVVITFTLPSSEKE